LQFPFELHQIRFFVLKSPLTFSFEFRHVLWDLMVSMVSVVFACLGGFGGFW
jgi:hypothetical protein